MKYLFFDCETTGIIKDGEIPRLIQLGWIAYNRHEKECLKKEYIIIPEEYEISREASDIHKITMDEAIRFGMPLKFVLSEFIRDLNYADLCIAHNFEFDSRIIENELSSIGVFFKFDSKKVFCTMESTSNICKIKGPYGYKWPKLSELYYFLFGKNLEQLHRALFDATVCAECFFELKNRNLILISSEY